MNTLNGPASMSGLTGEMLCSTSCCFLVFISGNK
jgi:hypothetical protein